MQTEPTHNPELLSLPQEYLCRNYLALPNDVYDKLMPAVGRHFPVLMVVIRNTHGRHDQYGQRKLSDYLSHEQIARQSGISETSVKTSLRWLEQNQFINIAHSRHRTKNAYSVRWDVITSQWKQAKVGTRPVAGTVSQKGHIKPFNGSGSDRSKVAVRPYNRSESNHYKEIEESSKHTPKDSAANEASEDWGPFGDGPVEQATNGPIQRDGASAALPPLTGSEDLEDEIPSGSGWLNEPTEAELELAADECTGIGGDSLSAHEEAIDDSGDSSMADPPIQISKNLPGKATVAEISQTGTVPSPVSAGPVARREIQVGDRCTREELLGAGWTGPSNGWLSFGHLTWDPSTRLVDVDSDCPF